jgi:hypothetical protein
LWKSAFKKIAGKEQSNCGKEKKSENVLFICGKGKLQNIHAQTITMEDI